MRVKSGWMPTVRHIAQCTVAVATFTSAASVTLTAQASKGDQAVAPFSTLYLTTGTILMDVSKLNPHFERTDLAAAKRPGFFTLSNDGYSVGFGGYGAVLNRVIVGGEFHSADMGEESSPTGKTNHLTTTYWMGTFGFAAFTFWKVNFIPFAGIGMGTATLTLKNREGGAPVTDAYAPTFDEVIMSPGSKSVMKGTYVMVQPGLALDLLVLKSETSQLGLTVGLRFASAITPNRTTWKFRGGEVFGAPDLGPSGGTVRIVAGIGGFRLAR